MHGSMANAMPQAIGARLLHPDRQVISVSGDGGFAMLMGDFITLSQYDLPVKIVVYNNGALGMVKLEMEVDGLPDYGTDLKNPNFVKMAEAMGVTGIRVEDPTEVRPAIDRALGHDGPVLVEVVTNPSELSMPPKASIKQAEGFSLYMMKDDERITLRPLRLHGAGDREQPAAVKGGTTADRVGEPVPKGTSGA